MKEVKNVNNEFQMPIPFKEINKTPKKEYKRRNDTFLKGPIAWKWLSQAATGKGKDLHVALLIQHQSALEKGSKEVQLHSRWLRDLKVNRHSLYRSLRRLESKGLIKTIPRVGKRSKILIKDTENGAENGQA